MNNSNENTALSFERILFFSDAVFAIVITLLVLELRPPHISHGEFSESLLRQTLLAMIPKFLGFIFSFFMVGILWIEHHRIFRFIGHFDFGLIWRNLIFLLCVTFVPFPTALFSEYFLSTTAFVLYTFSFAVAGITKFWVWRYAVKKRDALIIADATDELIKQISLRSLAAPIVCVLIISLSLIIGPFAGILFPFIPLVANLLYSKKREAKS
jgi:uncharacterized membrane protein